MAQRPPVRWNEKAGRWMAWVRFPDGARRKVERIELRRDAHYLSAALVTGHRRAGQAQVPCAIGADSHDDQRTQALLLQGAR